MSQATPHFKSSALEVRTCMRKHEPLMQTPQRELKCLTLYTSFTMRFKSVWDLDESRGRGMSGALENLQFNYQREWAELCFYTLTGLNKVKLAHLKNSWLGSWLHRALIQATSSSSSPNLHHVGNIERGWEVSPSTRRTIFSSFVVSWHGEKAGDVRQLREVSYFNLFSLWEMKRSWHSAKCQRTTHIEHMLYP